MPLKLGDQIPDFSLSDQLGVARTNKQAKGRPLVLFFYPKDDTPGCTAENCGFRDKYDLFKFNCYGKDGYKRELKKSKDPLGPGEIYFTYIVGLLLLDSDAVIQLIIFATTPEL